MKNQSKVCCAQDFIATISEEAQTSANSLGGSLCKVYLLKDLIFIPAVGYSQSAAIQIAD